MMKSPEEMKEQVAKALDGATTVAVFAVHPDGKPRIIMHGDPVALVNVLMKEVPLAIGRVFKLVEHGEEG